MEEEIKKEPLEGVEVEHKPVPEHTPKPKEHKHHKKEKKEEQKEEEISINFGSIKNFFKPKKTHKTEVQHAPREEKGEVSFDFVSIKNFAVKYKTVFLILIPLILAIFFRMQTASLPFTDKWAVSTVENYYKAQIKTQIDQQYPNLPDANKAGLIQQQYDQMSKTNKAQIDAQVKDVSNRYKTFFQDDNGQNYMPDIDPYVFLRYAENYLKRGYIGDEKRLINGKEIQWDTHQIAPLGLAVEAKTLHPYFLAYLHPIIKIFVPNTTPMQSASYFPVLLAALSIIPAFFIGRKLAGNVGGFFSASMLAIGVSFLGRSLFGHADTDAYNIFFPLFIVWMFLESFEHKDKLKQMLFAGAAGILMGIYSLAWNGWWYVFDFIIGALIIYLLYVIIFEIKSFDAGRIIKNENVKKTALVAVIFILISGIFVSVLSAGGVSSFINAPIQPLVFSKLKIAAHETLWPNVYTTVAELNPASMQQIISSTGGTLMFLISLFGIALLFITKRDSESEIPFAILVLIWYVGIFYASTKGVRFTMMLAPPFSIAFGAALGRIYKKGVSFSEKDLGLNKVVAAIVIIIAFMLLFIGPLRAAQATANSDVPIINDAWYNSLNKIKLESAPNAIVNSWWDFGHHFKYYADRAVTFDGGSQNTPMAHWIGKTLLTDDEQLAAGILKMLDCGSNNAFEKLNYKINDTSVSVKMLYDIVKLNKQDAAAYLKKDGLSDSEAQNVLQYTHCSPPEDYFITSEDMVGKAGVWGHFGSWDFDRADIWVFAKSMSHDDAIQFIQKNTNATREEAERLYFEVQGITNEGEANSWIAPWPGFAGQSSCKNIQNQSVVCDNGVKINLTTMEAEVPTQQGIMPPSSLVYAAKEGIIEKKFDSKFPYSIAFVNKENPFIVVMQPQLATSMFTRLYYFEGYKLKYFKPFSHEQGLTGTNVYVWKLDWQGSQANS